MPTLAVAGFLLAFAGTLLLYGKSVAPASCPRCSVLAAVVVELLISWSINRLAR